MNKLVSLHGFFIFVNLCHVHYCVVAIPLKCIKSDWIVSIFQKLVITYFVLIFCLYIYTMKYTHIGSL